MKIEIAKHGWEQVGGDMDPATYGGTIATADGRAIEIRKIQPVREHVGDRDAAEVGFPFWTRDGYFDMDDLDPNGRNREEIQKALGSYGQTIDDLEELRPESRAMAIAEALLDYGRGDEGPAGWSKDVVPDRVKWWGSKRPAGWRYLQEEDVAFRQMVRER